MVSLDRDLIFTARRLTTGANIHRLNTLLFQYEQAVRLHNRGHHKFHPYPDVFEQRLRAFLERARQGGA
jgi:hypothetical protein